MAAGEASALQPAACHFLVKPKWRVTCLIVVYGEILCTVVTFEPNKLFLNVLPDGGLILRLPYCPGME